MYLACTVCMLEYCGSYAILKFVGVVGVGLSQMHSIVVSTCVRGVSPFNYACVVDGVLRV